MEGVWGGGGWTIIGLKHYFWRKIHHQKHSVWTFFLLNNISLESLSIWTILWQKMKNIVLETLEHLLIELNT